MVRAMLKMTPMMMPLSLSLAPRLRETQERKRSSAELLTDIPADENLGREPATIPLPRKFKIAPLSVLASRNVFDKEPVYQMLNSDSKSK